MIALDHLDACAHQLHEHPLCAFCSERAIVTRATLCVDAGEHHKDRIVSLCADCATVTARMIAEHGFRLDIGLDGYPLDPLHALYRTSVRAAR